MFERKEMWPRAFKYYFSTLQKIREDNEIEQNEFLTLDLAEYERDAKWVFEAFGKKSLTGNIFDDPDIRKVTCKVLVVYIDGLQKILDTVSPKYGFKELKNISSELKTAKEAYDAICKKLV